MNRDAITLWEDGEYDYKQSCGFMPNMVPYLHGKRDGGRKRPCMIVVPGGGYCVVSPSEGGIIANTFFDKGYQTFVVTYSCNPLMIGALDDQPLKDLSRAVRMVRANADKYDVDPDRIYIVGFSAGAHLCASICVHFMDAPDLNSKYSKVSNRPNAAILSYPVITSGEFAHQGSFQALLGRDIYDGDDAAKKEKLHYQSLETQVTDQTPPCFMWHTATDGLVPCENSLLFAAALKAHGVKFGLHIFTEGNHGLSLANSNWAHGWFGENYCDEQKYCIKEAVLSGEISLPDKEREDFLASCEPISESDFLGMNIPNPEVSVWPDLADDFLSTIEKRAI